MTNATDIHVVITTYQRPESVLAALRDVLSQSLPAGGVWVVEDGPASDLQRSIREAENPRAIPHTYLHHEQNRGLAAARNTGWQAAVDAGAAWVAFMDDDDRWSLDKLEQQARVIAGFDGEGLGVVTCGRLHKRTQDAKGQYVPPRNVGRLKERVIAEGLATTSSAMVVRAAALKKLDGFDATLRNSIDHDFWMALAAAGFHHAAVDEPLVITQRRAGRQTLMKDPGPRLAGLDAFCDKWRDTWVAWMGQAAGRRFESRYRARVQAMLAGEIARDRRYAKALGISRSALTGGSPGYAARHLIKHWRRALTGR